MVDNVADQMVVFSDTGFEKKDWHPTNLRICQRGEWNSRMLIETVLSMLTKVTKSYNKDSDVFFLFLSSYLKSAKVYYLVSSY